MENKRGIDFSVLDRKRQVSIRLDREMIETLSSLSKMGGLSVSQIIRKMIHDTLRDNKGLSLLGYQGKHFEIHNVRSGKWRGSLQY